MSYLDIMLSLANSIDIIATNRSLNLSTSIDSNRALRRTFFPSNAIGGFLRNRTGEQSPHDIMINRDIEKLRRHLKSARSLDVRRGRFLHDRSIFASCGFTLIELVISVLVLAVLIMVAVPSFSEFLARQAIRGEVGKLQTFFSTARSEALSRQAQIEICWNFNDAAKDFPGVSNIDGDIAANSIAMAMDDVADEVIKQTDVGVRSNAVLTEDDDDDCVAFTNMGFLSGLNAGETTLNFKVNNHAGEDQIKLLVSNTGRITTSEY